MPSIVRILSSVVVRCGCDEIRKFGMRHAGDVKSLLNGAKKGSNASETGRRERKHPFDWSSSCDSDHQGRSLMGCLLLLRCSTCRLWLTRPWNCFHSELRELAYSICGTRLVADRCAYSLLLLCRTFPEQGCEPETQSRCLPKFRETVAVSNENALAHSGPMLECS